VRHILLLLINDLDQICVPGQLRPISPTYLHTILELLLNLLISLSLPPDAAPVGELTSILDQDHEIHRAVSEQVMSWFGSLDDGRWKMDAKAVVKEIGLGLLMNHKVLSLP
jgi:sister chromatid cohesion protein DCC1